MSKSVIGDCFATTAGSEDRGGGRAATRGDLHGPEGRGSELAPLRRGVLVPLALAIRSAAAQ